MLLNNTFYDPEAVERCLRLMILAHGVRLIYPLQDFFAYVNGTLPINHFPDEMCQGALS